MIIFSNSGEIDPRLITTLGVNVKDSDSPIGYFGTGLKFAIATLLRTGHRLEIHSGERRFAFEIRDEEIRGKTFGMIYMVEPGPCEFEPVIGSLLGFTTDLGRNWEPWMAYRELVSNAIDERGGWGRFAEPLPPKAGVSHILVQGEAIELAWRNHGSYFLSSRPLATLPGLEIHPGPGKAIFYRGLRVLKLDKPALYTYNITSEAVLTEDRTLDAWKAEYIIVQALPMLEDQQILGKILCASELQFESNLNFAHVYQRPSDAFLKTAARIASTRQGDASASAIQLAKTHAKEDFAPKALELSPVHIVQLSWARETLARMGYDLDDTPVCVAQSLGADVLGLSDGKSLWLSQRAFDMGRRVVASTLLEEHLHHALGLRDCSRSLQNHLLDRLLALAGSEEG